MLPEQRADHLGVALFGGVDYLTRSNADKESTDQQGSHKSIRPVLRPNLSDSSPNLLAIVSIRLESGVCLGAWMWRLPRLPPARSVGTSRRECVLLSLMPLPKRIVE